MGTAEWPAFLSVSGDDATDLSFDEPPAWGMHHEYAEPFLRKRFECYIHRESARAWAGLAMWCMCPHPTDVYYAGLAENTRCQVWQALRDWLNGSPEQWEDKCDNAFQRGVYAGQGDA